MLSQCHNIACHLSTQGYLAHVAFSMLNSNCNFAPPNLERPEPAECHLIPVIACRSNNEIAFDIALLDIMREESREIISFSRHK